MVRCSELTRLEAKQLYLEVLEAKDSAALRRLCLEDLYFLLLIGCKRFDMENDWIYERVREVEANPDENLDLWSREHYKSTIITFGLTIQDILKNPEETIGIFSHTRPIAKSFLSQIKREFESNTFLINLFPDILWKNPHKEAPKWSLDDGIIVKRQSNPKESTIEAWGLVDGQPTSKHYTRLIYDDVVTRESVTTPEMIQKVTDAWALSLNLAGHKCKSRYSGTRYHANDTYKTMMDREAAHPRIYPATDDGTFAGKPVLLTQEEFDFKVKKMGTYIASAQLLQNPLLDKAMGFNPNWLRHYDFLRNYQGWNFYILVDPASKKKRNNDYTVQVVIGLAPDNNYYLVDGVRDRMNLTERTKSLFKLVQQWKPIRVGYEEYGMGCDIEHIQYVQKEQNYRFNIIPLGGQQSKPDRIRRLVPIFENGRFYMPHRLIYLTTDLKSMDFVHDLIEEEYSTFPISAHDDMMDCISRIVEPDLQAVFPKLIDPKAAKIAQTANTTYDVLA